MTEKQEKIRKPRETTYEELTAEVARLRLVESQIVTRGVNSQGAQPRTGLDLGDIHQNVSWRDIRNIKDKEVN